MECNMQVTSLTKGKIRHTRINGREIIIKKSAFEEIKKIEEARIILKGRTILLGGKNFTFHVPKIYDYKNNEIYMEFLNGNNLEIAL